MQKALRNLLTSMFSLRELEFVVRDNYPEVATSINWSNSPASVAFELVQALDRRGFATHVFLDIIELKRPRRKSDIDSVREHLRPRDGVAPRPASAEEWDVFLAHGSSDKPRVRELFDALRRHAPHLRIFFDEVTVRPGEDWTKVIPEALNSARIAVVAISKQTSESWYLKAEIGEMIMRKRAGKLEIVPVYLDGFGVGDVPYGLQQLHGLDALATGTDRVAQRIVEITR